MTRLLLLTSAGMLAGAWRLQQDIEAARWLDGARHICKQFAQGKKHQVQDRTQAAILAVRHGLDAESID